MNPWHNPFVYIGGIAMAAAFFVPALCGVGTAKTLTLGVSFQVFVLTLASIIWPPHG